MDKTLAMKLLEGKKVKYEAVAYPDTIKDAEEVATAVNAEPGQVFKTLVVQAPADGGPSAKPLLVMVPADKQLDLKKLAKAVKSKKLKMASHQQAEAMTGLQVGGISALALTGKPFRVYLDKSAQAYDQIYISAGQRGIQVKLAVKDLVKLTRARFVEAGS